MNILITGIPGTGKTTITNVLKEIYKKYKFVVLNDKKYSTSNKLGSLNKSKEYVVNICKLNKSISSFFKNNKHKNIILEGHLWCELSKINLKKLDFIIILYSSEKFLTSNMKLRGYSLIKIEENLFCQRTNYISHILDKKNIKYLEIKTTRSIAGNIRKLNNILKLSLD